MINRKPFLILAILFYFFALICIITCVTFATGRNVSYSIESGIDSGLSGGATGLGIIASAFILCGSFFLYKHLTNKSV